MKELNKHRCFGGTLSIFEHTSKVLGCDMRFSVFLPSAAETSEVPAVTFLSGLTCTHENFTTKAGAYKAAAALGLAVIAPDTSPRGDDVPDDADSYDFGKGAGFYINATQMPWAKHYKMEDYIAKELHGLIGEHFPIDTQRQSILGHSMGGHGALTLYLKYPDLYKSASAFSPIVAPTQVPWGKKAFSRYLGDDEKTWENHDASILISKAVNTSENAEILIDQGLGDQFLEEQLKPEIFEAACAEVGQKLTLRRHDGYDHSYYFIQSFIDDHLRHHAKMLA